jgi:hypothetical protein
MSRNNRLPQDNMRYQENIPPEQLTLHASDDMLLFTAVLSILIGSILIYLGHKGRQLWMVTWSIGLIICSVLMGVSLLV